MSSIARKITQFTKKEIDCLFKNARRIFRDSTATILLAPRQHTFGRILIVTSRAVGNAPQRNKIRRRIKSLFYEEKLYEFPFDCVIIVYKKAVELTFDQLKSVIMGVYRASAQ